MFLIAGPCAIESRDIVMHTAETLKEVCSRLGITLYFKSSYDKANRTSMSSRGVGMEEGLKILQEVKTTFELPILTDVHESWHCAPVAEVADVLQIPAFLSRQTDLLVAAAKTGRIVNVKKGQFMAPWDMRGAIAKIEDAQPDELAEQSLYDPSKRIWLTERGSSFGYGNIVVDMTSLVKMREYGCPVVFDATHSVQMPGSNGDSTGGDRRFVPVLANCAMAAGADVLFFEVHPDPDNALCDGPNMLFLKDAEKVFAQCKSIFELVR